MGAMQRNKGKAAEREVINTLQPAIDETYAMLHQHYEWFRNEPPVLQRNTLQCDRGGCDIAGLTWWAPEVKHHAKVTLGLMQAWWAQTMQQARDGQLPVLFYRGNNTPWRVRMPGSVCTGHVDGNGRAYTVSLLVDTSLDEWLGYFKAKLYSEAAAAAYHLLQTKSPTRRYQ